MRVLIIYVVVEFIFRQKSYKLSEICITMNGRTRRSSNVNEDKCTSTNKKRKSTIGNNHIPRLYNTNNLNYQNAVITNRDLTLEQKNMTDKDNGRNNSMRGKRNSIKENGNYSTSDSELSNDSKDEDDELTKISRKDK